jgi:hypothetical protein
MVQLDEIRKFDFHHPYNRRRYLHKDTHILLVRVNLGMVHKYQALSDYDNPAFHYSAA